MTSCIDFNCILTSFKEYSVIISVLVGVASFFTGWYFNKKNIDIDAEKKHFEEIKKSVIVPVLKILRILESSDFKSSKLPSWRNIEDLNTILSVKKNHVEEQVTVNELLLNDLLDRHYIQLRKIWDNAHDEIRNRDEYYNRLRDSIQQILDEKIEKFSISTSDLDTDNKRDYFGYSEFDRLHTKNFNVEDFMQLKDFEFLIEKQQYVYLLPEKISLRSLVYRTQKNNANKVLLRIKEIYKSSKNDRKLRRLKNKSKPNDPDLRSSYVKFFKEGLEKYSIPYQESAHFGLRYETVDLFNIITSLIQDDLEADEIFGLYKTQYIYSGGKMLFKKQGNNVNEILLKIREICKIINDDDNIKSLREKFENSQVAFQNRQKFILLKSSFDQILHQTRLLKPKCKFTRASPA